MSTMAHERIPELTLGWRLKMALGPMHVNEMADALEISRTTISRWLSDRIVPPKIYIRQWALITQTDPTWLLTGQQTTPHPGPDEGLNAAVRREGLEPPTRWFRASGQVSEIRHERSEAA